MFDYQKFEEALEATVAIISDITAILARHQQAVDRQHAQELLTADPIRTVEPRPVVDAKSQGA